MVWLQSFTYLNYTMTYHTYDDRRRSAVERTNKNIDLLKSQINQGGDPQVIKGLQIKLNRNIETVVNTERNLRAVR